MSATGFKTYLDADLAREVTRLAQAQGRSESSLIADAVRLRLAASSASAVKASADTSKRQLNRLELRFEKLLRDQALIKESLLLFVRVWLEHHPPLPDAIAESAAMSAEARFARFLDLAALTLARGGAEQLAEQSEALRRARSNEMSDGCLEDEEAMA